MRNPRDIKLITTRARRNYLVLEPTNMIFFFFFSENLLAIEMNKTQVFRNKPVSLGLSMLAISKIVIYEFWCDCVKQKYGEKQIMSHGNR